MKSFKKSYFLGLIVVLLIVLGVALNQNGGRIRAKESSEMKGTVSSEEQLTTLPKTEADLHNQDEISIPEMEAFMDGRNFQDPRGIADGKITGAMTNGEYQNRYKTINQQQNDAWNAKYGFNPIEPEESEYVKNYAEFKKKFNDDNVSKIVLANSITSNGNVASNELSRKESIEIDGNGYELYLANGCLNVDQNASLASFNKDFGKFQTVSNGESKIPLFHMHDIAPSNTKSPGAESPGTNTCWSFVNSGAAANLAANTNRRFVEYRIGNIHTPKGPTNKKNSLIQGRLVGANQANISIWGHNEVITSAENFYTGGVEYEPFTYYKGEIAVKNYSTIWFIRDSSASADSTGTNKFIIGDNSFVYLNNTGSGETFPGVYEFWDNLLVGENATFNVNVPGSALFFNMDNAKFTGKKGSTVNLLSRATSQTISFSARSNTNVSQSNPTNTVFEMQEKSKLFVVGNVSQTLINNQGVVAYGLTNRAKNNRFILDSPESFDIRNTASTSNAFLGGNTVSKGEHSFTIKNSDISLWDRNTDIDGSPTYDYGNVGEFKVTTANDNGAVTSTDKNLEKQYVRPNFKRISGMNTEPELIWTPVTDADYSQKGRILLGFTAAGGSDPFDENGDAKLKPVYADDKRKGYTDFTDTLGNTFVGMSSNDTFVHWEKVDHTVPGFQLAGQNMLGTPYRASLVDNKLTPYRTGDEAATTVIDVTPPEPAVVTEGRVTNATKQLIGKDAEAGAKIYVEINKKREPVVGKVEADGTWTYDLPKYLTAGDEVQIFLEDNAEEISKDILPDVPATNSATGNINPETELRYRDATFKAATKYKVEDVLPDKPSLNKTVVSSSGSETKVGDTLTYTIIVKNNKKNSVDWANVVIEDIIPNELAFDPAKAEVKVDDVLVNTFNYDLATRKLTVDLGDIQAESAIKVTFKTTVELSAVGKIISNEGVATGDSPREKDFVPGANDPSVPHEIYTAKDTVVNPGGAVLGILEFYSAPKEINFGIVEYKGKGISVKNPTYMGDDLVVKDSRSEKEGWALTAKFTKPMTNDASGYTLDKAMYYMDGNRKVILSGDAQNMVQQASVGVSPGVASEYNISDDWTEDGDGFKLEVSAAEVKKVGIYEGEILWELVDAK